MNACDHPVTYNTLCVKCGKVVPNSKSSASLALKGGLLQLSADEAAKVQTSKSVILQKLQQSKKLALVLDLDHTLLHAVQVDGPTPNNTVQLDGEIHHLPIEEIVGGTVKHLVMKKRPHLDQFLEQAEKLFQLTIYTAGTKRYAEAVVKVIDPTRKYIGDRIVSRIDGQPIRPDSIDKSLEKIFLNDASMAVIMDDREDVWKGNQSEQLLLVRPYVYFYPGSASTQAMVGGSGSISEVNNNPGNSSIAQNTATSAPAPIVLLHECPGKILKVVPQTSPEYAEADDQLLRCWEILKQIHSKYYGEDEEQIHSNDRQGLDKSRSKRSVALALREMKKNVLKGYTITFSGIIATNEPHPENHPFWKLAESLGAQVSLELLPRTTHLLSFHTNTKKVKQCLQSRARDVWVLHPDWLIYCRWALSKAEESTFLLVGIPVGQSFPNPLRNLSALDATGKTVHGEIAPAQNSLSLNKKRKAGEVIQLLETRNTTSNNILTSSEDREAKRVKMESDLALREEGEEVRETRPQGPLTFVAQHDTDEIEETMQEDISPITVEPDEGIDIVVEDRRDIDDDLEEDQEQNYVEQEGEGDCRSCWENGLSDGYGEDENEESDDADHDPYSVTYSLYSQSDQDHDDEQQQLALSHFNRAEDESDDDFADLEDMIVNVSRQIRD